MFILIKDLLALSDISLKKKAGNNNINKQVENNLMEKCKKKICSSLKRKKNSNQNYSCKWPPKNSKESIYTVQYVKYQNINRTLKAFFDSVAI